MSERQEASNEHSLEHLQLLELLLLLLLLLRGRGRSSAAARAGLVVGPPAVERALRVEQEGRLRRARGAAHGHAQRLQRHLLRRGRELRLLLLRHEKPREWEDGGN